MDWMAITPSSDMDGLELGFFVGKEYYLLEDAQEKLEDTYNNLCNFASSKKTRQRIIFKNSLETDIIPVINAHVEKNLSIYEATIKVLSELTAPIEDYIDVFIHSDNSNLYHYELKQFLTDVKNKFMGSLLSSKLITPAHNILTENLSSEKTDSSVLKQTFRLIYNILSIPEPSNTVSNKSISLTTTVSSSPNQRQNQIIWNFFAAGLDNLIFLAIEKDTDSNNWSIQILEVIAVIYKDQSVHHLLGILKKLLDNPYYEESSEDNESNTSSTQQNLSMNDDSSDCNTREKSGDDKNQIYNNSDAMSYHSSDSATKEPPNKKMCGHQKPSTSVNTELSSKIEKTVRDTVSERLADSLGATKILSTGSSSNDDDQSSSVPRHKKNPIGPHLSSSERREIRIKKILKIINKSEKKCRKKSMVDNEDVSKLLTEFTICFIMKGYASLIQNLRLKLMSKEQTSTFGNTHSHFLWLITFFMRFALYLELNLPIIEPLFSPEVISYLVFEGLQIFENIQIESKSKTCSHKIIKSQGRRLHLVVSAIKQILITINSMDKNAENAETRTKIQKIILSLIEMSNLRQLHLMLIRKFNPSYQTRRFIHDVIMTNHELLVMFEKVELSDKFIEKHLEQFATVEVMRQYGYSLETFQCNADSLNEAIFTMMHHVSGDLNAPEALFIPQILKTFSDVWEKDLPVGDEWSDLIEYVIQKFINTMRDDPVNAPPFFLKNIVEEEQSNESSSIPNGRLRFIPLKNNKKLDNLQWHYSQCKKRDDPVGSIIEIYKEADNVTMTRQSVLQALLSYGIITHAQYIGMAKVKPTLAKNYTPSDQTRSLIAEIGSQEGGSESGQETLHIMDESMEFTSPPSSEKVYVDEIEGLKDILLSQGKEYLISWLQKEIVNVIFVKVHAHSEKSVKWKNGVLEPVAYYSSYWNENIPMVPWSMKEESGLQTENFLMLLKKIGVYLPTEINKHFPRIPLNWSIEYLLKIYQKLGSSRLKEADLDMGQHSFLSGTNSHYDANSTMKFHHINKQISHFAMPKPPAFSSYKHVERRSFTNS